MVHRATDIFFVLNTSSTESFAAELLATHMTLITQLRQHRLENSRNPHVSWRVYDVEDGTAISKKVVDLALMVSSPIMAPDSQFTIY